MPTFYLSKNDLLRVYFTYSPIQEICWSYYLLKNPTQQHLLRHANLNAWMTEANRLLEGCTLPYMDALIDGDEIAACLFPKTYAASPKIEDELRLLRATPTHIVCQDVSFFMEIYGFTPARRHFLTNTASALGHLVEEMMFYWERALAVHWPRILSVLRGDIHLRTQTMAIQGLGAVLEQLHSVTTFHEEDTALCIDCWVPQEFRSDHRFMFDVELKGNGLIFQPTVFHTGVTWALRDYGQSGVDYGAWGAGRWRPHVLAEPNEELASAMGKSKARLLRALMIPASTSELARLLGLAVSSVSAQLQNLNAAGLVNATRNGHRVVYRLSERGERLLAIFD